MQRPRPSFWIATATIAALALGGGVAAARDGRATVSPTRQHTEADDQVRTEDNTATTTTTLASPDPAPVAPPVTAGGPGNPWVDDHGHDDPATHDVGDDHGVDDPATHDIGDDHGVDDPATHDVGDDHGGDDGSNRGPGGGDDSGHDDSGHDDSGHDDSGHGGPGPG